MGRRELRAMVLPATLYPRKLLVFIFGPARNFCNALLNCVRRSRRAERRESLQNVSKPFQPRAAESKAARLWLPVKGLKPPVDNRER
jgi:hypothetical protein